MMRLIIAVKSTGVDRRCELGVFSEGDQAETDDEKSIIMALHDGVEVLLEEMMKMQAEWSETMSVTNPSDKLKDRIRGRFKGGKGGLTS